MPGPSFHALETVGNGNAPSQVERFRSAAKEGPVHEELVGLVAIDTGLRAGAIAHLTEDWLKLEGSRFKIKVPYSQRCTLGVGPNGKGGDTTDSGVPCNNCRGRQTNRDWLPTQQKLPDGGDCWVPKSEAGAREIPVKEDDTQQILLSYFKVHDSVMTRNNVSIHVKSIADRAGILEKGEHGEKDWPTAHDLRDTYGHRLARRDFNRFEIMSVMGHASVQQAQDYIDLSGRETDKAFDEKW